MATPAAGRTWAGNRVLLVAVLVPVARLLWSVATPETAGWPAGLRDSENKLQMNSQIIPTLPHFTGPESLAFHPLDGRGPFTGVSDGRVLLWDASSQQWTDFAFTSPNRSEEACKPKLPPVMDLDLEVLCGRPLGLRFNEKGDLYIADAYYGVRVVGSEGGLARPLVEEAEGIPLKFCNDVDFGDDGVVFFTDSSTTYQKRHFVQIFLKGDDTGRLLAYDPATQETKVLLRGLNFPNGIAMSEDKTFLLICETLKLRILRYWVQGEKAGKVEVFAKLPGFPDNVRRTKRGDFWVAIHAQSNWVMRLPVAVRRALVRLPIPLARWYVGMARKQAMGMVARLGGADGAVLEVAEDAEGKKVKLLSGLEEHQGKLWLGSVVLPQIAVYPVSGSNTFET